MGYIRVRHMDSGGLGLALGLACSENNLGGCMFRSWVGSAAAVVGGVAVFALFISPGTQAAPMDYPPGPTGTITATPTGEPTREPIIIKVPEKDMPNPPKPVDIGGGVVLPDKVAAKKAGYYNVVCRLVRGDFGTPVVNVPRNKASKVQFGCRIVPQGTPVTARIWTNGRWVNIGTAKASKNGMVVLPAMAFKKSGTWTLLMSTPDSYKFYFTIAVP